jgi:hypothetical protein
MQQPDLAVPPEVEVGLYLIGDFVPEEVGRAFDVTPVFSVAKGSERRHTKTGVMLGIYDEATWGFTSAQAVRSNEILEHATWIIEKSASARGLVSDSVHAFIEVRLQAGTSFVLPENLMNFARELGAEIGIVARTPDAA